jgi:Uma2 family endonuclease
VNVAWRKGMTGDEFLVWEARQELRHEFDGVGQVAIAGAREAHADIQANLITALRNRLRGRECRAYGADMMVSVDGSFRYPDALIVCGPRRSQRLIALDPVVVFEIVSESTAATDRLKKNLEYRNTPSIQRDVIIEQTVVGAEVFTRAGSDWVGRVQDAGSILDIPEAGITVPVDELYDGLTLSA